MSRRLLVLLPLLLAAGPASVDPAKQLSGRYYRQFPDGLVNGEKYKGEDILEIVPVAPGAAYFRIHLDYFNGHTCSLSGIAGAEGNALVYRDHEVQYDGKKCVLRISRAGRSLSVDDGEQTCHVNCGARGSLSRVNLPYASKRPIRYLARLKTSSQYRDAMAEWRKEKQ